MNESLVSTKIVKFNVQTSITASEINDLKVAWWLEEVHLSSHFLFELSKMNHGCVIAVSFHLRMCMMVYILLLLSHTSVCWKLVVVVVVVASEEDVLLMKLMINGVIYLFCIIVFCCAQQFCWVIISHIAFVFVFFVIKRIFRRILLNQQQAAFNLNLHVVF